MVNRVNRTVVYIVVLSSITRPRDQWARSAQRSTPFELIVAIQVHSIAAFIHFFIEVGKWRNAGDGVVSQILSPTSCRAIPSFFSGALAWHVDFTIVDVAIRVQHWNDVDFTGVDKVGNPLFRVVLIDTMVARSTIGSVTVGVLEFCSQTETVAIVVELSVTVGIAPCVFIHQAVAVVVVADVLVRESNHFQLHHGNLHRHPFASVVVSDDHHVVAIRIVAGVAHEGVVIAILDVSGDFHPRRGMAVIPTFVGVGRDFFATSIGASVHALVEGEDVRIVLR